MILINYINLVKYIILCTTIEKNKNNRKNFDIFEYKQQNEWYKQK